MYFARRYEEAAAQFKRVIAMDENYVYYLSCGLLMHWTLQGNEAEAFEWFMKLLAMQKAG